MTISSKVKLDKKSQKIEIIGGESEPAELIILSNKEISEASVSISLKGDFGHNGEYIDLSVNGQKAEVLTTKLHNTDYQHVLKLDITKYITPNASIVLYFKPTRNVNKLWQYAWGAIVEISASFLESTLKASDMASMLESVVSTGNQLNTNSQALSVSSQNLSVSQQQTTVMQNTSSAIGIQAIFNLGSSVSGNIVESIIDKKS